MTDEQTGIGRRRESARRERSAAWLERHDEILAAAAELFRERGFQATNITDIAARLGIHQSNVYYYFGKKEELLVELVHQAVESNVAAAEGSAARRGSAIDRLGTVIESLATSYDRHYPLMQLYVQEDIRRFAGSEAERFFSEQSDRYEAAVLKIARQGVRSGEFDPELDPELVVLGVLGAVNWMHRWFSPGGRLSGEQVGRQLRRLLLNGITAR